MTYHGRYVPAARAVLDPDFDDLLEDIFVPPPPAAKRTKRCCISCREPIIGQRSKRYCAECFDKRLERRIGA
jgi:hypothetical protein